jgi:hypothetical protein
MPANAAGTDTRRTPSATAATSGHAVTIGDLQHRLPSTAIKPRYPTRSPNSLTSFLLRWF